MNNTVEEHIDDLIEKSLQKMNIIENKKNETETIPNNVDAFNTALHQYLEIEEEVKVLLTAIKQRNQKKKELGLSLSSYLRENKIKNVNLGGTYQGKKLVSVSSTTAVGFNKVSVTDAIYNELKDDEEIFAKIMEAISKKSIMKEIWKIKITDDKVSKTKKTETNLSTAEELLNDI
jgi:hypothetical protein